MLQTERKINPMNKKIAIRCLAAGLAVSSMFGMTSCKPQEDNKKQEYIQDGIRKNGFLPANISQLTMPEKRYYTGEIFSGLQNLDVESLKKYVRDPTMISALEGIVSDEKAVALWKSVMNDIRYFESGNVVVYRSPLYTLGKYVTGRDALPASLGDLTADDAQSIFQKEYAAAPYVCTELSAFIDHWTVEDGKLVVDLSVFFQRIGFALPTNIVDGDHIAYAKIVMADADLSKNIQDTVVNHKAISTFDMDTITRLLYDNEAQCKAQSNFYWTIYVEKYLKNPDTRKQIEDWMKQNCYSVTTTDKVVIFFKANPATAFPFAMMSSDEHTELAGMELATYETVGNFPDNFQNNFAWIWNAIDALIGAGKLK